MRKVDMPKIKIPGGLTRAQWLALTVAQRVALADRAQSDLLQLWRTCKVKRCRRAQSCTGDGKKCKLRPYEADFKNPNFGRPDFRFSFRYPKELKAMSDLLDALPFRPDLLP